MHSDSTLTSLCLWLSSHISKNYIVGFFCATTDTPQTPVLPSAAWGSGCVCTERADLSSQDLMHIMTCTVYAFLTCVFFVSVYTLTNVSQGTLVLRALSCELTSVRLSSGYSNALNGWEQAFLSVQIPVLLTYANLPPTLETAFARPRIYTGDRNNPVTQELVNMLDSIKGVTFQLPLWFPKPLFSDLHLTLFMHVKCLYFLVCALPCVYQRIAWKLKVITSLSEIRDETRHG